MSEWTGQLCPICGEGELKEASTAKERKYRNRIYKYVEHAALCSACGDGIVIYDEAEEKAWSEFVKKVDQDFATLYVRVRKQLKMTQAEIGALTGGGKNAISRYEHGLRPVAGVDNLIMILDRHPELINELT